MVTSSHLWTGPCRASLCVETESEKQSSGNLSGTASCTHTYGSISCHISNTASRFKLPHFPSLFQTWWSRCCPACSFNTSTTPASTSSDIFNYHFLLAYLCFVLCVSVIQVIVIWSVQSKAFWRGFTSHLKGFIISKSWVDSFSFPLYFLFSLPVEFLQWVMTMDPGCKTNGIPHICVQ